MAHGVLNAPQICPHTPRCRITKPILPIWDGGTGRPPFPLEVVSDTLTAYTEQKIWEEPLNLLGQC